MGHSRDLSDGGGAFAKVNAETMKANAKLEAAGEKPSPLPLPAFEPYVMRHTALTANGVVL